MEQLSTTITFSPPMVANVRVRNFTDSSDLNGLGCLEHTSDPERPSLIIAAITFILRLFRFS